MIIGFDDVQKAADDVLPVRLDWTPFLPTGATISAHDAYAEVGNLTAFAFGGGIPPGLALVTVTDAGVSGNVQTVRLSGGNIGGYTAVSAKITLSDGTVKVRSFIVRVR